MDAAHDKIAGEYGWNSIEAANAEIKVKTLLWSSGDGDIAGSIGDGVMDREERNGGDAGILSDTRDCDTYNFARFFEAGDYKSYGDEEIRARKIEPTAEYHVELDWANPGCQSKGPYGPKK